nr:lysophospholipid acyltransferase family protein [Prosthecomicrobium pneumaticum]
MVVAGLVLLTLVLLPVQLVAIRRRAPLAARVPHWWHRVAARLVGLRVRVEGVPARGGPVLLLSNHVSWLDIVTLSAVMPVSFVAKAEVNGWPVVKWLARLQRTVFVDRTRRSAAGDSAGRIAERLHRGEAIVLFPEGTTGDGYEVLPFRSALVGAARDAAADGAAITVQPVAVVYRGFHGLPMSRAEMPRVAWYGGMDLASHLGRLVGDGGADAVVAFGRPVAFGAGADRKRIAAEAEREVRTMVRAVRARRPIPAPPAAGVLLNPAETR